MLQPLEEQAILGDRPRISVGLVVLAVGVVCQRLDDAAIAYPSMSAFVDHPLKFLA